MSFLTSLMVRLICGASAARFEAAARSASAAQLRKLLAITKKNQNTEYGREHGFASVRSLKDWQAAVPVAAYGDLQERVARVTRGERNVLTAEDPVMFARTSGTTGDPKYIPVTPTCLGRDHQDQMRTWLYHALLAHPGILSGKVLSLVSPAVEGYTPSGIPYGSTSGHIYRDMPGLVRRTYLVPYRVFEIEDYEAKYYTIMRLGVAADVTLIATANPSSVIKMCEIADAHADSIIRDIADGTLRSDLPISPETRTELRPHLAAQPALARRLEVHRSRRGGRLLPADYWPRLALIGCWKGGTVGAHLERFPQWFDPAGQKPVPVRDWGYLSSEARGSVPTTDEGAGGILTVGTNVYEFVPVEHVEATDDRQTWSFLGVDQVEVGEEYYIFFTTTGGLYRYDINDVVEVVGRHHTAPEIVFRRKGRGMTNITGEKVSVNQVIDAVQAAARELAVRVEHFRAEADEDGAFYLFRVEPADGIPAESRRPLLEAIERHLRRLNIEYDAKRESRRLHYPQLYVMKRGWYDREKKALTSSGRRLFQAKTTLLARRATLEQLEFLDEIVNLEDPSIPVKDMDLIPH